MPLDVLHVVQLARHRIIDIDREDLPISLAFVEETHDGEGFDLFDLACSING